MNKLDELSYIPKIESTSNNYNKIVRKSTDLSVHDCSVEKWNSIDQHATVYQELVSRTKDLKKGNASDLSYFNQQIEYLSELVTQKQGAQDNIPTIITQALKLLPQALQLNELDNAVWIVNVLAGFNKLSEAIPILNQKLEAWNKDADTDKDLQFASLEWLLKYAKSLSKKGKLTHEDVSNFALDLGYGYKAINLRFMEQQQTAIRSKLEHCELEVPSLIEFSDMQMRQYISKQINFAEIDALWKQFLDTFDTSKKLAFIEAAQHKNTQAIQQLNLLPTEEGIRILDQIQEKLKKAFSEPFNSRLLSQWLNENPCSFVIVRSTGREDSDTNSNAGGNASVGFKRPTLDAITPAIGEVIASYYGTKSIKQRLQCGDITLFNKEPFLPVFIQKMVCEKNMGGIDSLLRDIPRSGVLFTREQGMAEVTMINAAFGSNEGVVSSQVDVDTYYVHRNGIYSIIRQKPTRFVQQVASGNSLSLDDDQEDEITVGPISNGSELARMPALTPQMIRDLNVVASELAGIYGDGSSKCMDMEFTIDFNEEGKPVIHLLQIRPLMSTIQTKEPSYIKSEALAAISSERQVKANVLMAGAPFVRRIDNCAEQVIFADDLPKALHEYQDPKRNAYKIQAIVIRKTAPLASHEAVTLRPTGVPVLVIKDLEAAHKAQRLFFETTQQNPLYVCPQRGVIAQEGSVKEMIFDTGLIAYPGTPEISARRIGKNADPAKRAETIFLFLHRTKGSIAKRYKQIKDTIKLPNFKEMKSAELFDLLAMEKNPQIAEAALLYLEIGLNRQLTKIIDSSLGKISETSKSSKNPFETVEYKKLINDPHFELIIQPLFDVYYHFHTIARFDVKPSFQNDNNPQQHMNRLFYLKALQALVVQNDSQEIVSGNSFKELVEKWKTLNNKVTSQCKDLGIDNTLDNQYLLLLKDAALSDEVQEKWSALIRQLNERSSKYQAYKKPIFEMAKVFNKLNMLVPWMNLEFAEKYQIDSKVALDGLVDNFNANKITLDFLAEKQIVLETFAKQVKAGNWSDSSFVKKNIKHLLKTFARELGFDKKSLPAYYKQSESLGKLAVLELCQRAVTVFDSIIKEVKGSSRYENKIDKAQNIAELLEGFFLILETVMNIANSYEDALMCTIQGVPLDFFEYLSHLKNGRKSYMNGYKVCSALGLLEIRQQLPLMNEQALDDIFKARSDFIVSAIAIGSHADLNYSALWPTTLEEHFTTVHQSIESIVRFLRTKLGLNESILPKKTSNFVQLASRSENFGSISSMNVQDQVIDVYYQIPLRQHAATVAVRIPKNDSKQPLQLTIDIYGNEEFDRWKFVSAYGAALVSQLGLQFADQIPPKINYNQPNGVTLTLEIPVNPTDKNLHINIIKSLNFMLRVSTMNPDGGVNHVKKEFAIRQELQFLNLKTDLSWIEINPEFYSNSLLLNMEAMNQADKAGKYEVLAKIAENTLKALEKYKLKDFYREGAQGLDEYFKRAIFANDKKDMNSLTKSAFLYLIKAADKCPKLLNNIKTVLTTGVIPYYFKEEASLCIKELMTLKEKSEKCLNEPTKLHWALIFAYAAGDQTLIQQGLLKLSECCKEKSQEFLLQFVNNLAISNANIIHPEAFEKTVLAFVETVKDSMKFEILFKMLSECLKESGNDNTTQNVLTISSKLELLPYANADVTANYKALMKKKLERMDSKKGLDSSMEKMYKAIKNARPSLDFAMQANDLVDLITKVIIGLGQSDQPFAKEPKILGGMHLNAKSPLIGDYLNNSNYAYFYNNDQKTTLKSHKLASFALVYLLEKPETRGIGIETLSTLINDYILFGSKDISGQFVKEMLFNITIAFINKVSVESSEEASKLLSHLWNANPHYLEELLKYMLMVKTRMIEGISSKAGISQKVTMSKVVATASPQMTPLTVLLS